MTNKRSLRPLVAPLAYTAVLYGTLPFVRGATDALRSRGLLRTTLLGLALALAWGGWRTLVRRWGLRPRAAAALVAAVATVYGGLYSMISPPEEFTHFIEYGALALLWMKAGLGYGGAALLCVLTGLGDETLQGMLPRRFFEWRDVGLNVAGSALGLMAWAAAQGARRRK